MYVTLQLEHKCEQSVTIQCHHLESNYCQIATKLASLPVVTCEAACTACGKQAKARSVNTVTIGQAFAARKKAGLSGDDLKSQLIQIINNGPGTELERLVPKFFQSKKCNCKKFAAKMNLWGVEGCLAKRERIINHLIKQSKKLWILSAVPTIITRAAANSLFDKAIEISRKNNHA